MSETVEFSLFDRPQPAEPIWTRQLKDYSRKALPIEGAFVSCGPSPAVVQDFPSLESRRVMGTGVMLEMPDGTFQKKLFVRGVEEEVKWTLSVPSDPRKQIAAQVLGTQPPTETYYLLAALASDDLS